MYKKIAIILIVVLFATAIPCVSAAGSNIQPLYNNIESIVVGLGIDEENGLAYCAGEVEAYYNVPVEVLVQLQVYKNGTWKTLMSWSDTGTGYAQVDQIYSVDSGYNYKVKVTGYICNDLGLPIESETEEKEFYYPAT